MCNTHHSVKASKTSFEECELGGGFNISLIPQHYYKIFFLST